ncbi:putative ATPase/DNA-binding SARP family transcriptional activator [Streptomyces sp. V4I23]|uniref:BTAD domain-containing putative transcriptional regulator n=1 Tax=Streptomyces sp. V4I23 TaxID=3042282 RepID=UPI00278614BF|nr:BTAD domain-containing putative transcriptional regulator [Streptomyces sp. V4I23]MDQ1011164.1 putative ATPase/DNA-binding SARP family transcriptional activator [Streptomyces sp. V4I23]
MRFCLLGTTQAVRADGTPVALGGARLRALLTVLAQRAGRTVPVAVLVDEVWDGDPPADAHGAVQALVGRLRRAVGHEVIASADGGYRLSADPDAVDLHRFDRLTREGAQALADGDAAGAAALLDEALALWRGPVLADLPDRTAAEARWEARRLEARRTRLAAALALGRAGDALPELAALCGAHPLDEPLHALRIRALRDTGRAAQALAAYEEVRKELADRLGADPGAELLALYGELLTPAAPVARGNLRARLTSFVGREPELRDIRADLGRARLVTLIGTGGSGKTRLSLEAAEHAAAHADRPWPDGVWLAELAPVDDPETVPETVLTALGGLQTVLRGAGAEELRAAEGHTDDAVARLVEHCARRRMLLVLDNCEHVVESAARLAERLLESCPGLTILATSREPLGVPGELVRPVDPLPAPAALRLFAERGASARPGFRVDADEETERAAVEICRRLDGLPLAIELAAARLRMLTPRQIADRLDDRFRLLTSGSRTVLPRQQTLRAVVDWSWDLLTPQERAVLRRLSVFASGCALPSAEHICAGPPPSETTPAPGGPMAPPRAGASAPGHAAPARVSAAPRDGGPVGATPARAEASAPEEATPAPGGVPHEIRVTDVADVIGALVDKSLVVAEPAADGCMRYRLLETVAEYAGERLDEAGERESTERRHLVHYRELARTTDPLLRGAGQRNALARLQLEYENLRTALRRAVAARDEHEALCLVLSLAWYWHMRDLRTDARHWSEAVAALHPDPFAPPARPAPPLAERCTDAPPPMTPELLDEARRQVALVRMVSMDHTAEDWTTPGKQDWLRRVVTVYGPGLPQTCRFPASLRVYAVLMTGDGDEVLRALDETVRTAEAAGHDWELATALQARANILANRSVWAGDARRDADRSLRIHQRLGDVWGSAEALSSRGEASERRGAYEDAAADYRAAVELARTLGAQSQAAVLRTRLASVLLETGADAEAEANLRDVVAAGPDAGHEAVPMARMVLALRLGRTGRTGEARHQLEQVRTDLRGNTLALFEGIVIGALAWLDVLDGRHTEALAGARRALAYATEPLSMTIAPQMPAVHVLTAARAVAGLGGPERARVAARLIGAYEGLLPAGHVPPSVERDSREQAERAARAALADEDFAAAYAQGGGLTVEEAAALM